MRFAPLGDSAIIIRLGSTITPEVHREIVAARDALRDAELAPVIDIVPGYTSLTVYYDAFDIDFYGMRAQLETALSSGSPRSTPGDREWIIPVRYDGPDLAFVADQTGMDPIEVIQIHSAQWYEVCVIGFVPGFAYLGPLPAPLILPRRPTPRTAVPAGSVAIAGCQTAIYPLSTPGGWHLLGSTSLQLFDPHQEPPSRLAVGDRVRFEPR